MKRRSFQPGFALTAQAGLALVVVLALAMWQASRGIEKSELRSARLERLAQPPIASSSIDADTAPFTRVRLSGRYEAGRQFSVADGTRAGVQAWSVFKTSDQHRFLVNRGLVASPNILPEGEVTVVGVIWPLAKVSEFVAGQPWPAGWPKRMRWLDVRRMCEATAAMCREVRLESGNPGVGRAASLAWDDSPGMHWGYVVQWLLIGAAVAGGYVVIGLRRGREIELAEANTDVADAG